MAAIHPDRARSVGRRGFYICSNPALYSFRMALRPSRSGRRTDSTRGRWSQGCRCGLSPAAWIV